MVSFIAANFDLLATSPPPSLSALALANAALFCSLPSGLRAWKMRKFSFATHMKSKCTTATLNKIANEFDTRCVYAVFDYDERKSVKSCCSLSRLHLLLLTFFIKYASNSFFFVTKKINPLIPLCASLAMTSAVADCAPSKHFCSQLQLHAACAANFNQFKLSLQHESEENMVGSTAVSLCLPAVHQSTSCHFPFSPICQLANH